MPANHDPFKWKKCRDCGMPKGMQAFYKDASRPDGHAIYCKQCFNKRNKIAVAEESEFRKANTVERRSYEPHGTTLDDVEREDARAAERRDDAWDRLRENTEAVRPVRGE